MSAGTARQGDSVRTGAAQLAGAGMMGAADLTRRLQADCLGATEIDACTELSTLLRCAFRSTAARDEGLRRALDRLSHADRQLLAVLPEGDGDQAAFAALHRSLLYGALLESVARDSEAAHKLACILGLRVGWLALAARLARENWGRACTERGITFRAANGWTLRARVHFPGVLTLGLKSSGALIARSMAGRLDVLDAAIDPEFHAAARMAAMRP